MLGNDADAGGVDGMYLKTTPARPARAEKRKGHPPARWACVANRPGGRPPGPVGGPGASGEGIIIFESKVRFD